MSREGISTPHLPSYLSNWVLSYKLLDLFVLIKQSVNSTLSVPDLSLAQEIMDVVPFLAIYSVVLLKELQAPA